MRDAETTFESFFHEHYEDVRRSLAVAFGDQLLAEEMAQDDGVGAPPGWEPVDAGDARVFVPGAWNVEAAGTCIGGSFPGMASVGKLAQQGCTPASEWPIPPQAVSLFALAERPTGTPTLTVHGYAVYRLDRGTRDGVWTRYAVPQLGTEIAVHGSLSDRVIATLAPAARKVALAHATQPIADGRVVATDGVKVTVPVSWSVTTPSSWPCDSGSRNRHVLQLGLGRNGRVAGGVLASVEAIS